MSRSILGLGFLQKDDVGVGVSAQDTEILSIRGPVKRKNLLRGEICDLAASRTVNWLNPNVIHAILANGVGYALAIEGELRASGDVRIGIE